MHDWMKDWEALQRQFVGAMSDLARGATRPPESAAPWQAFTQAFAPAPAAPAEVLDRLNAGAKGYFAWLQSLAANAGDLGATSGAGAWTEAMRKSFNPPGIDPSLLDNPVAQTLRDFAGQGAKGFDVMMADFAKAAAPFKQEFAAEMGLPAFGLAREHQERWQALARAMAEYQEQSNRYQALLFGTSRDAFERFQGKLAEREEPGRQIESARQLYDLWIDAAEEAYADAALSPQFREVYGAMVNAQMRVRALVQGEVERAAAQIGLPTRTEVRSLEKAVHELRRAMKKPAAAPSAPGAKEDKSAAQFKAEIEALRAELAAAKRTARNPESHAPRAAAPAKKKSAKAAGPAPSVSVPAPARPSTKARKR